MATKEQKIKAIQEMRNDLIVKLEYDELDQAETELIGSYGFLACLNHKGLDQYLTLLEGCVRATGSVNRKDYL
ncbi:hypothetical protein V3851_26195 [Paenibacillus sp. M1]|uniref:Uncharacterized protein n=1 Tax=Paenibacillus haidiansis TaxID=1574488 RepID=A0ABU7W0U5_9BACL